MGKDLTLNSNFRKINSANLLNSKKILVNDESKASQTY